MLQGLHARMWPLVDRREQPREIVPRLPDTIRYSETFNVFVVGGSIPNGDALDTLLVGYNNDGHVMFAASVSAGIPPEFRRSPTWRGYGYHAAHSPTCLTVLKDVGAKA
jgi:hypothetical protein